MSFSLSIARRTLLSSAAALALSAGLAGNALAAETIKIGLVTAMSGQSAKSGEAIVRGLSIAIDEVNAKGGLLGKKVELLVRDDESNPAKGVVAARDQSLPPLPDSISITRDEREAKGPLEGIRAGWNALPASIDAAYITSCDVPLLVPAFVERMIALMGDHDIAVMEVDGFPHPLSAIYRRNTLPHVESLLAADRLRPVFLFDAVRTRRVKPEEMTVVDPELKTLRNLNTPDDYRAALADAGMSSS